MTGKVAKLSNYPQGFQGGVAINGEPLTRRHSGKVFYVGAGDTAGNSAVFPNRKTPSDGNKGSFLDPFKTIDYAVGQCLADRGDIIYVLPGYVELITTEGGIEFDVEGITVVGLGTSDENMPVLDFTAVASEIDVAAAGVSISGLLIDISANEVTNVFNVADGSDGLRITGNLFTDGNATNVHVAGAFFEIATSDEVVIADNRFLLHDTEAETTHCVEITGISSNFRFENNYVFGSWAEAALSNSAADINWQVLDNVFINEGPIDTIGTQPAIEVDAETSGYYRGNHFMTNLAPNAAVVATNLYDAGGNTFQTGEANPPVSMQVAPMLAHVAAEVEIETTISVIDVATVTGSVAVWGVHARAQDGGGGTLSKFDLGVESDLSALWAATDVDAETLGDIVYSVAAEGAQAVIETAATTPSTLAIWPAPIVLTGEAIDVTGVEIGGIATAVLMDIVFIYQPLTAGAKIA